MAVAPAPVPSPAALWGRLRECVQAVAAQYDALPLEARAALRSEDRAVLQAATDAAWLAQDWPALKAAFAAWHARLEAAR
jgi:hypothetical protein